MVIASTLINSSSNDSNTVRICMNDNGGYYANGKGFGEDKYLDIIECYHALKHELGHPPSNRQLARKAKISYKCARKTKRFINHGGMSFEKRGHGRKGAGSIKQLTDEEEEFLLALLEEDPSRSLDTYRIALYGFSGKKVSKGFMSMYWKKRYEYAANFRKTSVFQPRKYTEENILRLLDYLDFVQNVDPDRLVFIDEKPLRGMDIFGKKVRRHPKTGVVPSITVDADLRNMYTILCAIRKKRMRGYDPVQYRMGEFTGDSETFDSFVIDCLINEGFFREGDILVADNAKIHTGGYCEDLAERLHENYGVYLIFLPTFTPELNPTELVFNTLIQCMRSNCFHAICQDSDSFLARLRSRCLG